MKLEFCEKCTHCRKSENYWTCRGYITADRAMVMHGADFPTMMNFIRIYDKYLPNPEFMVPPTCPYILEYLLCNQG